MSMPKWVAEAAEWPPGELGQARLVAHVRELRAALEDAVYCAGFGCESCPTYSCHGEPIDTAQQLLARTTPPTVEV